MLWVLVSIDSLPRRPRGGRILWILWYWE